MGFHAIALPHVVEETFRIASAKQSDIKAIAITTKPGLSGSLRYKKTKYIHVVVTVFVTF